MERFPNKKREPNESRKDFLLRKASELLKDETGGGTAPSAEGIKKAARAAAIVTTLTAGGSYIHDKISPPNSTHIELKKDDREGMARLVEEIAHSPIIGLTKESFEAQELKCLTDNVYHESRGEEPRGQYAVAFATLERVLSKKYPDTICGVVHQPWQFSWTADKEIEKRPIDPQTYLQISVRMFELTKHRAVRDAALIAQLESGLPHGAMFYKKTKFTGSKAVQNFFKKLVYVGTIGEHDFFVRKEDRPKQDKDVRAKKEVRIGPLQADVPLPRPRPTGKIRES